MIKRLAPVTLLAVLLVGLYWKLSPSRSHQGGETPPLSTPPPSAPAAAANLAPTGRPVAAVTNTAGSREFDLAVNPYAAALREPGKSKRNWDATFLAGLQRAAAGDPIRFELTSGRVASGTVRITQFREGQLTYLSGDLTEPEAGKFFFLTPPEGGKAGKAVGVIEFPASQTAYRIEPTGADGNPELWQRRLDEVVCQSLPLVTGTASSEAGDDVENIPPLRPDLVPNTVPGYNSNVISLQSYPGSKAVLLLDFFGGYTPTWGGVSYPKPVVTGDQIKDLWKRVAEDFMGFNINVTTDIRVYTNAPAASRQKCIFTPTTAAMPAGAAGVAYIGSWNWGSDTVCWSIYTSGKNGAEVGSHEPGHTLGLNHQTTSVLGYYAGHGTAPTGWGPIMGVGYYQPVSSWAKGEYLDAQNHEDELAIITSQNNNVAYRPDDAGGSLATSRYLDIYPDFSAATEGVIERTEDTDAFQFTTTGGQVALTARPVGDWASLAVMATLADATDTIIASNNPQDVLWASINTNLPAGTYTFRVTGAGRKDPLNTGFSSYASLGYYSVAGSIAGGRLPTRLRVFERVPNGTVVGTVPASAPADALAFAIVAGNSNNTFSLDASGTVSVANNTLLDFNRLATNSMLYVQFELFVNITNLSNPELTELKRRVVISVLSTNLNYPLAASGFNAGVLVPYNGTVALPQATGFDTLNNWAFYQAGLDANPQVGGSGGGQGLPSSGSVLSQVDNSTFQLGPFGGTNALLLGGSYPAFGTLTLATPQSCNSLAFLFSAANGSGAGTLVLNFTNGTHSQVFNFTGSDWYAAPPGPAFQGFGRVRLGQAALETEDAGSSKPNLYQTTVNLAALGLNQPVVSVSFTNGLVSAYQTDGIFGLSGSAMRPEVAITQQPQSLTNNNPAASSTLSVIAMGAPDLAYQWYRGNPGAGVLLPGRTAASLVLSPVTTNDAANYFVVITNTLTAVTSSVATLSVLGAPIITQQPGPTNLSLLAGRSLRLAVVATAAIPLTYTWRSNGVIIPGATLSGYTNNSVQVGHSGNYTVTLSNSLGQATSSVVALTVLAAPTSPYAQLVLSQNPLGYWRLDETNGTVAHDYAGGRNGVYTNVLLGQAGNNLVDLHKVARFGVLANPNSYVANVPIDFATTSNASFSVEAWVNGGAQTTDAGLICKGVGGGGEQFNLDCGAAGHAFRFFVRDAGSGAARLASGTVVPNSQWHHVVGVCNQFNGNILLYVDGVQNASGTIPIGSGLLSSTNPVTFGSRKSGPATAYDSQFIGSMEDVAIYGVALTAAQVQAHYSAASNRPPVFAVNPFTVPDINAGNAYAGNIATNASDPNGDPITFSKISGPSWLSVAANGALSGTPLAGDLGPNTFLVRATDPASLFANATMNLSVVAPPITASVSPQGADLLLSWTGGLGPFQVQVTTNLANPAWENFGAPVTTNRLLLSPSNDAAFYRILGP